MKQDLPRRTTTVSTTFRRIPQLGQTHLAGRSLILLRRAWVVGALVISTLAVFALFAPLRRIQAFVDHQFYRRKYDAEKNLAAFSATVRSAVDLRAVREHRVAVVQETIQPTEVSLWLRSLDRNGNRRNTTEGGET